MIDKPIIERAMRVIAKAKRFGLWGGIWKIV
jgi:hypothetical protein